MGQSSLDDIEDDLNILAGVQYGVGFQYEIINNLSLKTEYVYNNNISGGGDFVDGGTTYNVDVDPDYSIIRAGLSYSF